MNRRFKIKVGSEHMLQYGIVLTMAYASYATLLYSFLGQTALLRTLLIVIVLGVDFAAIWRNQKQLKPFLYLLLVFGVLFAHTYIVYPSNRWLIQDILMDTLKYLMMAFFISIAKKETIYKSFKQASVLMIICNMFEPFTQFVTSGPNGYMIYGMRLLLPTVLLGYYFLNERNRKYLFGMIVGMILILLYGNRSALFISLLIYVFQLVFYGEQKRKTIRTLEIALLLILVRIVVMGDALSWISVLLERFGISSRTISLLQSGIDIATNNNGRSIIWENSRQAILRRPWTGYGIGGDRNLFLLGNTYISRTGGVYAHNYIYELLLDYGIVFGTMLLLFIIYKSLRIVFTKQKSELTILFSVLFISTALKLTFSSTIWNDMNTFICLGLAIGCYRTKMYKTTKEMKTTS